MSDPASDSPDYLAPYAEAIREHGPSFQATLWNDRQKQHVRFDVIASMINLTGRVVVDAGCGLGDLAARLTELGVEYGAYVGLEGMPEFVDEAQQRGLPEAAFLHSDFVADGRAFSDLEKHPALGGHPVDVVCFSGSLNTLGTEPALLVLQRAWDVAREGIVFNFLSSEHHRVDEGDTAPAIRFDTLRVLKWAMERTPRVLFRQDYFDGHDGTIAMTKP